MSAPDLEFVYVGDPMCSWCWGFAPVVEQMQSRYAIPIRTVLGGLRPGPAATPLDDGMRDFLAHHWHQVEAASGQPFDHRFLDRQEDWRYDTEPAARAVVAMRHRLPAAELAFFTRLQRAFYAEGVDVTEPAACAELAGEHGLDPDGFLELMERDETRAETWQDFAEARGLGVSGFPTLLVRDGERHVVAARGFVPADSLLPAIDAWLAGHFPPQEAAALYCEIGEPC